MPTLLPTVLAITAVVASANPEPPAPGEKVRIVVRAPDEKRRTGVVVATEPGALTVAMGRDGKTVRFPWDRIDRLEVARGRRRATKEGAVVGGAIGFLALGATATYATYAMCESASCSLHPGAFLVGGLIGGVPGAGIGALIGHSIETDRWERLPPRRMTFAVAPVPGGAAVRIAVPFGRRGRPAR